MTSAVRCTRRQVKPVVLEEATLLSKPVCCCEMLPRGIAGLLIINGQVYELSYNATLPDQGEPVVHGWHLYNRATHKGYDLDAELQHCDCPDFTFRCGSIDRPACKHLLAMHQVRQDHAL